MPYEIETADGIVIGNIPDNVPRDAPQLKARVQQARFQRRRESPEYQAKVEAQREADRELYDPAKGMSTAEKVAANWTAGYENLTQGIRQLAGKVGIGSGVTDEEVRAKRELDERLAQTLPGWWGKGLQMGSEILPTLAIPVGALPARIGKMALGPTTRLLAGSALGSSAQAALSPVTEDESRATNMMLAAGVGAAIPGVGVAAPVAVRGARNLLTEAGAKSRAARYIADTLGDNAPRVLRQLDDYKPPTLRGEAADLPTTAAQATGDARLAQAEAYSRSRPNTQPNWADFDAAQNAARYEHVQAQAPSALRVERLERARTLATTPKREAALSAAAEVGEVAQPVLRHVQDVLEGASSANPAVKGVANYVKRELSDEAGAAVTPARLYEVRKTLAAKLGGPTVPGDELSAAAKGARQETRALIEAIDNTLEGASGGQWRDYLTEYGKRSRPVESGQALRSVAEKIEQKPLKGTTPEVTAAGYSTALRQATEGKFGSKLTPEAKADANALREHLRQAEAAQRTRKLAATMGGGSITNTDQALRHFAGKIIETLPGVGGYAERVTTLNREAVERHIAQLLQSPTELGEALRLIPPEARSAVVDEILRGGGMAAAQGATP